MTYVVGFREFGVNSIISDACVTFRNASGISNANTALKTGELFPGCIFGRSGNEKIGRDFILASKLFVQSMSTSTEQSDLVKSWRAFEEFISFYDFPRGKTDETGHFKILLSTRFSGKPEFYILDSYNRTLSLVDDRWVSIGSGKPILDSLIEQDFLLRIEEINKYLEQYKELNIYPYFFCLWLSELTLSAQKQKLERYGVGGVFHFIYQTSTYESPQEPALYVLSVPNHNTRTIYCWLYRVCHVQGCLAIEDLIPPDQISDNPLGNHKRVVLCNEASQPGITDLVKDTEFIERIKEELNSSPFYVFCGFGFTNPADRKGFGFHFSNEGNLVVSKEGIIAPLYQSLIASHFDPNYDLVIFNMALQAFNRAIEADPNNVAAYYNRGTAYAAIDKLREAILDFDKAIELGSDHPRLSDIYNNRAHTFLKLAILDYEKYLELVPDAPHRELLLQMIEQIKAKP